MARVFGLSVVIASLAALTGGSTSASSVGDDAIALTYRGTLARVTIGTITADIAESPAGYRVDSRIVTQGPLNLILSWDAEVVSTGRFGAAGPEPQRYWLSGKYRGEPRHMQVSYSPAGATVDSANPDPAEKPDRIVPAELRRGTLDPLGAFIGLGQRVGRTGRCEGISVAVFDGRLRYDVRLSSADATPPVSKEAAVRCRFSYEPIAGFRKGHKARAAGADNPGIVWFQRLKPDLPPIPTRIEVDSDWGPFVLDLVQSGDVPNRTAAR